MQSPTETAVGQAWLGNFREHDRATAELLLDSLRFASLSTLSTGLKVHLEDLMRLGRLSGPVWVVPERKLAAANFGVKKLDAKTAIAFRDFEPGAPLKVSPGSDGLIATILRDFTDAGDPDVRRSWIAPNASLGELRDRQCRTLAIVTDYMGSGRQITALAAAISRNPTIRSWRSAGFLEVVAVPFAASAESVEFVERADVLDAVFAVETSATFSTQHWSEDVERSVTDLCLTECRIRTDFALGFDGSRGLFVSERGAPNNLPALFFQQRRNWQPLFGGRKVPAAFARDVVDYRPRASLSEVAFRVGQLRVGRNERINYLRGPGADLLRALVAVSRRPQTATELSGTLSVDVRIAQALLDSLGKLRFVDANGQMTSTGRDELAAYKRGRRRTTAHLAGVRNPYYPHSLR